MIRLTIALCFVLLVVVWAQEEEKYTDQYDDLDIDSILNNPRLVDHYVLCLKSDQPNCPPEALKLKELLPDVLQTGCTKCSEVHKTKGRKVVDFVIEKRPNDFLDIEKLYDPEHIYRKKYEAEITKEGIVLPPLP